jgi:hypothetical protein
VQLASRFARREQHFRGRDTMLRRSSAALLLGGLVAVGQVEASTDVARSGATLEQQQEGRVRGRVIDRETLRPLAGVQVHIPAIGRGAISGPDGAFLVDRVPAGTHELQVTRIGYRSVNASITVAAGQTAVSDISLVEEALVLDELIVTGTAGGARARSIGNVVSTINAEKVGEIAPVATLQQLLNGRTEGVSILPLSGNVGTGAHVRIRGTGSLSLTNQPLIYVDGVRINNQIGAGPELRSGRQVARIEDINPEHIVFAKVSTG